MAVHVEEVVCAFLWYKFRTRPFYVTLQVKVNKLKLAHFDNVRPISVDCLIALLDKTCYTVFCKNDEIFSFWQLSGHFIYLNFGYILSDAKGPELFGAAWIYRK